MTWIRSTDFLSGLLFIVFGVLGLVLGAELRIGTGARMGPGYFPMLLCFALIGVGSVLVVRAILAASARVVVETMASWQWRPLLLVTVSFVLFGLLVERTGMVIAMTLLICIGAFAGSDSRWREVLVLAAGLVLFSLVAFVWGLGLPLRALPL